MKSDADFRGRKELYERLRDLQEALDERWSLVVGTGWAGQLSALLALAEEHVVTSGPLSDATHTGPVTRARSIGALAAWRRELLAGFRGQDRARRATWRPDALWRAACQEANARDYERLGMIDAADGANREAARLIVSARKRTVESRSAA